MVKLDKNLVVAVFVILFTVLMIGNSLNIADYEGISYRNHSDVVVQYPDGEEGSYTWENSSYENIEITSDGYLTRSSNSLDGRWQSKVLRINDNRKIVYEADIFDQGEAGITIQVSDNESFDEIKDIQKEDLEDGFNEIELDLDRGTYTKLIVDFDRAADQETAVNRLNIQGVRSDVKTGFSDVLGLAVFLLLFWFGVKIFGSAVGWWD